MWIPIVFIMFIAIVSVVGIIAGTIAETTKRTAKLDLIRLAIEKGQTLDPALIDKLMPPKIKADPPDPAEIAKGLRIGGTMGLAFAIGLVILGYFLSGASGIDPKTFPALQGAGGLFACLSIGMFVAAKVVEIKTTDRGA